MSDNSDDIEQRLADEREALGISVRVPGSQTRWIGDHRWGRLEARPGVQDEAS